LVLGLAQQEADGRVVVGGLELRIHGGQVEVELARVLGLGGRFERAPVETTSAIFQ
jgi:hypothetical protein